MLFKTTTIYKNLLFLLGLTLILACQSTSELSIEEYMSWVESSENEAQQRSETSQIIFNCHYLPPDYIAQRELRNGVIQESGLVERKKQLEKSINFRLSIVSRNGKSIFDRSEITEKEERKREHYLRNQLKEDLILKDGNNVLKPAVVQLVRSFGIKTETDLMIAFKNKKEIEKFELIFNNKLLDTTEVVFQFDLNKIPELSN